MRTLTLSTMVALLATALATTASAEGDAEPAVEAEDDTIILWLPEPEPEPKYELTYEDYRLQELERTAKRSRNALIGTSVTAAVGLALVLPAASSQCESVEIGGQSQYECTRTGDALIRAGSPLVIGGLTGALVSGIILGVRKGKIRRMNDSFALSANPRKRVRWDERTSRFVF